MVKNCIVAQSGGPTAAINASLAGVISGAMKEPAIGKVYGGVNGIYGILNRDIVELSHQFSQESALKLLACTPAMALGSCRHKLPSYSDQPEVYEKLRQIFREYNIGYFFYIGGNDSMDTACKLSEYFASVGEEIFVLGIPKTIDNDLLGTDHTPGFGSAAKFIATSLLEIIRDSEIYPVSSVTIIEIMGRNSGWLTASAMLPHIFGNAAPHLIYLPEVPFSTDRFLDDVRNAQKQHASVIVAVSEGIKTAEGRYVGEGEQSGVLDVFGHRYLSGTGKYLEHLVSAKIGCKVRSVELNVLQRCSGHLASETDLLEAQMLGETAVQYAVKGETGKMVAIKRLSNTPYRIEPVLISIDQVANLEKTVPLEWINSSGNMLSQQAIDYLLPLIQGEVSSPLCNGLPVHFQLDKTRAIPER